jgi:signal transduction histidine kinase/CheY-like chemotaxis protein
MEQAMGKLKVLHLEDNPADAFLIRRELELQGYDLEVVVVETRQGFQAEIVKEAPQLILSDNNLADFTGLEALSQARRQWPEVPFIFVSGSSDDQEILYKLNAGAADYVEKGYPWQLIKAVQRWAQTTPVPSGEAAAWAAAAAPGSISGAAKLIEVVQRLSFARSVAAVQEIVRKAARELTGADGATFVLRDGDKCFYADEDAISPLWKGQRFPLEACISGWAMLNGRSAVIEDIYADPRIPADAYRPTFVKSLAMVPIRSEAPIGAIGNYWATRRQPTREEVELLQALANATSLALENVQVYSELEQRVEDRTRQLAAANRELEAFSSSVSHDLRAPLRAISGYAKLLTEDLADTLDASSLDYLGRICSQTRHMQELIEDLLRLASLSRGELRLTEVDLSGIAAVIAARLQAGSPERQVDCRIQPGLHAVADEGLLRVVLENLLSNAWKYSGKQAAPRLEFGEGQDAAGRAAYIVRDNGAGFDMQLASRLFAPFQRLHSQSEFPGTGVGLATVQRIIQRHGGEIWAEGATGHGATFYFTLSQTPPAA